MKKIVVLSGAGISAESGIKTFRDANGLWEGHDVMEVASPIGWDNNPALVLDFYNQRRKQLPTVLPNKAHYALAELDTEFHVSIVTQNVDNLHERAGSKNIVHLHGELLKMRSTIDENLIYPCKDDIKMGDRCEKNSQLRPHIVWFGEAVPMMEKAMMVVDQADILMIVGTSMQVYPAAGLVHYARHSTPVYFIDPNPSVSENDYPNLKIIPEKATVGIPIVISLLTGS